jgi:hypothetical protein
VPLKRKVIKMKLKSWAEKLLIAINMFIGITLISVNDFNLRGFFILIVLVAIFAFNAYILEMYGRSQIM